MKNHIKINKVLLFFVGLLIFIFTSCNNSDNNKTKELELQKKESELKERELLIKEKELSQQGSTTQTQNKNTVFYIISVAAVKFESEAKAKSQELKNNVYKSGYLWIPDYASLSGAKFYSVYIGPFSTQYDCEVATEEYRKKHPEAYGLLVSQDNKRVQINGIGKVTISENKNNSDANINVESFNKLPNKLNDMFGIGAGCWYSKTKGGQSIFLSDVSGNAVMKINNKFIIFKFVENKPDLTYAGEDLEVTIKITKTISTGIESVENEGYIIIKTHNGSSIKINIWGGCGA